MNRSELQIRIDELADDFLQQRYDGKNPTIEEFANANPDISTPLKQYLRTILMVDDIRDDTEYKTNPGFNPAACQDGFPQLDDYEVIREIGRGGMGIVYEAHHLSLDRTVALKVLPSGLFQNPAAVKRFQLEAKSAARLHHTNIVPIFDVDQKDDICYYAMQFIEGQSLDYVVNELGKMVGGNSTNGKSSEANDPALSDTMKLGMSSTSAGRKPFYQNVARLGKQAAEAIHHAHENGIVHRDIKPANLMLDFNGTVWVMDFGLAKTDESNLTQTGDVVGTLRYMSPERFAGQCDRSSDIYSLGMTLYELLGQRPAFGHSDRLSLIDSIKTSEPESLHKIDRNIPRDLETIVGKAIEKDPRRRYSTAGELSADLSRFISGQPILARRVGNVERLWLWAKKRKALATSLAALLLLLVAGTVASAVAASYYRDLADQNLALAKSNSDKTTEAQLRTTEAQEAQKKAEANQARTDDVLDLVTGAFESVNPRSGAKADMLARDVLLQVESDLKSSLLDDMGRAKLLNKLILCYYAIGEYKLAISVGEPLIELSKKALGDEHLITLGSRQSLARAYQLSGQLDDALQAFEQNAEIVKSKFGKETLEYLSATGNLANVYYANGRVEKALATFEENVPIAKSVLGEDNPNYWVLFKARASCLKRLGRIVETVPMFEEAMAACRSMMGEDHPITLDAMSKLADAYNELGQSEKAVELFEKTIGLMQNKLGGDHSQTINTMINLLTAYNDLKRTDEAIELGQQTTELIENRYGSDHPLNQSAMNGLALAYKDAGRNLEAVELQETVLRLAEAKLGEDHFSTVTFRGNLASMLSGLGRDEKALELREKNLTLRRSKLGDEHPGTLTDMQNLASSYLKIGQTDKAVPILESVLDSRRTIFGDGHPQVLSAQSFLAVAYQKADRLEEAIELMEETRALLIESQGEKYPRALVLSQFLGSAYMEAKRTVEGLELLEQTLSFSRETLGDEHRSTLTVLQSLGKSLAKVDRLEESEQLLAENLATRISNNPEDWATFNAGTEYGSVLLKLKQLEESGVALLEAYDGLKRIKIPLGREDSLANVVGLLQKLALAKGETEEAEKWQDELEQVVDSNDEN